VTDHTERILEHVVPGKRLGRHIRHDPRSLQYPVGATSVPLVTVTHERVSDILDQGDLGSCTGNAAVGALGTKPLSDTIPAAVTLDETFAREVYSDATAIDPYTGQWPPEDTGSDGLSVAKVLKTRGLIAGYLHGTNPTALQTALQTTPVIVGVNWYAGFDTPDTSGRVEITGGIRGGHEFEIIGVDFEEQLYEAVNSWGRDWGLEGHFFIPFTAMARLLKEHGDCTQLLPVTVPAPTPTPIPPSDVDRALLAAFGVADPAITAWAATIFGFGSKAGKAKRAWSQFSAAVATWRAAKGL
jgi:hypothetical protein